MQRNSPHLAKLASMAKLSVLPPGLFLGYQDHRRTGAETYASPLVSLQAGVWQALSGLKLLLNQLSSTKYWRV